MEKNDPEPYQFGDFVFDPLYFRLSLRRENQEEYIEVKGMLASVLDTLCERSAENTHFVKDADFVKKVWSESDASRINLHQSVQKQISLLNELIMSLDGSVKPINLERGRGYALSFTASRINRSAVQQHFRRNKTALLEVAEKRNRFSSKPASVEVIFRDDGEKSGSDELLLTAIYAGFVGLTFKSLSDALHSSNLNSLPKLTVVELCIYALPLLKTWHPTLKNRPDALEQEWTSGLYTVLNALGQRDRFPALKRVDVVILNRIPSFTASVLTVEQAVSEIVKHIRYTPVIEDIEPAYAPTFRTNNAEKSESQKNVFEAFDHIVTALRRSQKPLVFPAMRDTFMRTNLNEFVQGLTGVCNRSPYAPADALFTLRLRIPSAEFAAFAKQYQDQELTPDAVDFIVSNRTISIEANFSDWSATLTVCGKGTNDFAILPVRGRHIIAAFSLLSEATGNESRVVLRDKYKRPWAFDVPGGKVTTRDQSIAKGAAREVFEELALDLGTNVWSEPVAIKYDPRSQKEGKPVVAVYYHVVLTDEQRAFVDQVLRPTFSEWGLAPIVFYSVPDLITKKTNARHQLQDQERLVEAECHAPIEALERVLRAPCL
jgi:ADP-ribose pyrophosphatase YjhB (NUDIX family)/DNA-binding winged helix-turn-helix (wHTH) protein